MRVCQFSGKRLDLIRSALYDAAEWQSSLAASLCDAPDPADKDNCRRAKILGCAYRDMLAEISSERPRKASVAKAEG